MGYETMSPLVNKLLNPDGSITDLDGNELYPPDVERAAEWERRVPIANKVLNANGSITGLPGGGSGASPPFSTDETATGQIWVDGSPVYRRTFTGTVSIGGGTVKYSVLADIAVFPVTNRIINAYGYITSNAGYVFALPLAWSAEIYGCVMLNPDGGLLLVSCVDTYRDEAPYAVVVEYVKAV